MGFYKQLSQTIYYILRSLKMIFTKKNMFFFLFIAVFVACCVFSNKVFAEEQEVSLSQLNGYGINNNGVVYEINDRCFVYFHSDSNMIYHITSNFGPGVLTSIWVSESVPTTGSTLVKLTDLAGGETYDYYGNLYFVLQNLPISSASSRAISVTSEYANNYDNTINSLSQAISLDNLWSQFGVSLIALAVLFAIGFFVVRKVLKKDSQYKG